MSSIGQLIDLHYPAHRKVRNILLTHSRLVADKALFIAQKHPELKADALLLEQGALVHDIGIVFTQAPDIDCHGPAPYLQHGIIGGELLRQNQLAHLAGMAENHTGAGLSQKEIIAQGLPLPHKDLLPTNIEESIIAFADKFYSKGKDLLHEKPLHKIRQGLERHGDEQLKRFDAWCQMFL